MDTYSKYKDAFKYAPGSAAVQQMVGESIGTAIDEVEQNRKKAEEKAANRRKNEILNYQFAKQKAKDLEDLNILGDTASTDFNEMLMTGSRQIADYAAYLNKELKRTGDYDTYASEMAKLKTQVSSMKGVKTGVNDFLNAYQTGKIDKSISSYNSENLIAMAEDMLNGSPEGGWQNINGQQVWVGKTVQGKEYKVAASEFQNLSKKLQKKEDVQSLIDEAIGINTTSNGNVIPFDQKPAGNGKVGTSALEAAEFALENLINSSPGNKDAKVSSLLVDHYGYTREEADALADEVVEDEKGNAIGNRAEEVLKAKWLEQARNSYGINSFAINEEKRRSEDQKYQHQEQKARDFEFKRNQEETISAFNNPRAAIWNQDMEKFKDDDGGLLGYQNIAGLINQFQSDLQSIGLSQSVVLEDNQIIPATRTEDGQEIDERIIKGKPKGIIIQNPNSLTAQKVYIPFTASPLEIQNLIRQAQGLPPAKRLSQASQTADFQLGGSGSLQPTTSSGLPILTIQ
jgi:hypothetical protein